MLEYITSFSSRLARKVTGQSQGGNSGHLVQNTAASDICWTHEASVELGNVVPVCTCKRCAFLKDANCRWEAVSASVGPGLGALAASSTGFAWPICNLSHELLPVYNSHSHKAFFKKNQQQKRKKVKKKRKKNPNHTYRCVMSSLLVLFRQETTCILFGNLNLCQTSFLWHFIFKIPIPLCLITVLCTQNRRVAFFSLLVDLWMGSSCGAQAQCWLVGTLQSPGTLGSIQLTPAWAAVCSYSTPDMKLYISVLNLLRSGGFLGEQPVPLSKNWLSLMTTSFGNVWYLQFDQLVFPKGVLAALRCHSTCCKI